MSQPITLLKCHRTRAGAVVTTRCPICDRVHWHGIAGLTDGSRTYRRAHCKYPPAWVVRQGSRWLLELWYRTRDAGYVLQLTEQPTM